MWEYWFEEGRNMSTQHDFSISSWQFAVILWCQGYNLLWHINSIIFVVFIIFIWRRISFITPKPPTEIKKGASKRYPKEKHSQLGQDHNFVSIFVRGESAGPVVPKKQECLFQGFNCRKFLMCFCFFLILYDFFLQYCSSHLGFCLIL